MSAQRQIRSERTKAARFQVSSYASPSDTIFDAVGMNVRVPAGASSAAQEFVLYCFHAIETARLSAFPALLLSVL